MSFRRKKEGFTAKDLAKLEREAAKAAEQERELDAGLARIQYLRGRPTKTEKDALLQSIMSNEELEAMGFDLPEDTMRKELDSIDRIVDNVKHQGGSKEEKEFTLGITRDKLLELKMKLPREDVPEANRILDKIQRELDSLTPKAQIRCRYCGYRLEGNEKRCPNCGGIQ